MDNQFKPRKTGKDKERRNREINGKYSAKHIRIQDQCQENHLKNIQIERSNTAELVEGCDSRGDNMNRKNNKYKNNKYKKK
jgi:hypothetical protein